MARYVVVNTKRGKYVTFYPVGEVMTKGDAVEQAAHLNEKEETTTFKVMPEMEYYRTYEPDTLQMIERYEAKKAQRKLDREAKKAAEAKKLAVAKAWWADDRNFA